MSKYINENLPKEQRLGQVGVNNQGENITIVKYGGAKDIDIMFEDGVIVEHRAYSNFRKGVIEHPIRYEESFAYYIIEELGIDLNDIWNWELNNKNGINPYEIKKCSGKKVWLYCQEHDYHNYDREGNKIGYEIAIAKFYNGRRCGYCHSKKVHYKDSLAYNYPQIAKMIAIEENDLTFEDCYNIACGSQNSFYFKCLDCGTISNKKKILSSIINHGYSCEYCSDGFSIPEKFMANILKQLNIDFQTQLTKSTFDWCKDYRYDFYIPYLNMIIETHGEQHYRESAFRMNLEENKKNDKNKKELALKNNIKNYITIDCRNTTLEWLKENITKEISHYFDLSKVNWVLAWEISQNSLCVETWDLWNSGIHSIIEICKILDLSRESITRYLKRGAECGKCDYKPLDLSSKKIICITTKMIFSSIKEGSEYYDMCRTNINACCKGKRKTAGKLEDGTKLVWRYLNINHNKILRGKDISKLHKINKKVA